MMSELTGGGTITRLSVLGLTFALGTITWLGATRWAARRVARQAPSDPLLAEVLIGQPAIVYFSTPNCVPCRTLQQPALERLAAEVGEAVKIIRVDAQDVPELADRWGVFSSPTTFVLDGRRTLRHINRGVATYELLQRQLTRVTQEETT